MAKIEITVKIPETTITLEYPWEASFYIDSMSYTYGEMVKLANQAIKGVLRQEVERSKSMLTPEQFEETKKTWIDIDLEVL